MTAMRDSSLVALRDETDQASLYALEVTAKDIAQVEASAGDIVPGTPINIAFLGNETHGQRIHAAHTIRNRGFEPVPIISSRRLRSERDADDLLSGLTEAARPRRFILVGGDPAVPAGPYADSIQLLESGLLDRHAVRAVGIVAYPEGHPKIGDDVLWRALKWKLDFLTKLGCSVEITTQFGFDADAIIRWIERLRHEGIDAPVRVGVPGPASAGSLLRCARQFGVITSANIVRKYGLSLTNLLQRVGPERFFDQLRRGMSNLQLGTVRYHLYPFGGISDGVRWMNCHAGDPLRRTSQQSHPE